MSFQIAIKKAEEVIPRLGKPELHWKKGRSAYELSTCWMLAEDIPDNVRQVIEQAPEWANAQFLEGVFERETNLPGSGRPSQTDLLAIVALNDGNAIIGVEGKVDEPFGPPVGEWLARAKNGNRSVRLRGLCETLGIRPDEAGGLFYQLLHRTCASVYEAKRFGYKRAIMLVHSFADTSPTTGLPACFEEFSKFTQAVGIA